MKRAIGVLFLTSLAMGLAACGGGDNTTNFVEQTGSAAASSASASASASTHASASPAASASDSATALPDNRRIIIDNPDGSSPISSPVEISGTASVDNGTVVAVVLDASGKELGRATGKASAAKPDFGHYDVSVSFSGATPGAKGRLKVFGVSPRDGTTPTYFYYIEITFA